MKIDQYQWISDQGWYQDRIPAIGDPADLVMVFGAREILSDPKHYHFLRSVFGQAVLFGCSTAGEIRSTTVYDHTMTVTAIQFTAGHVHLGSVEINNPDGSYTAGEKLINSIPETGLKHVILLSDGLNVNGSRLVEGIIDHIPEGVVLTGGLSADGSCFQETLVIGNQPPVSRIAAIIGLYGESLRVAYGSEGGWDPFGPERIITRSKGNILYELDEKSALDLYKQYLGQHARDLPASGLLFPLCIRYPGKETSVVRTILSIDDVDKCMTFAGNMPEGAYARFMKANFDRLVDGAIEAANHNIKALDGRSPELALLISCIGRKMVLKQRIEEEVEGVRDILGASTVLTGFYSYGEISPFEHGGQSELHNQTMTITSFAEIG
ncbi:MAG: FIST C-terminal domain-containing protein [Candidatus Delongbacteria bacterium]|nr:FIST C-terminal domain-containing protein [Candidatus Delongbacteria bacterium]